MIRLRLRPYLLVAALLAVVASAWALIWGGSAGWAMLGTVLFLALTAEVLLGVWALASSFADRVKQSDSLVEKARSQLNWRVQYEAANLFKSLKGMHQDNVDGWRQLADHPHGARRQGDRAVKALKMQEQMLLKQQQDIAALRDLVVELVARVDSAPDQAETRERLSSADLWVADAASASDGGSSQPRDGESST